jgi:hypothetical protein
MRNWATSLGLPISNPRWEGKWLELLLQIAPQIERVGLVYFFEPHNIGYLKSAEAAAPSLNKKLVGLDVHNGVDIESAIAGFAAEPQGGLIIAPNVVSFANSNLIVALAARYRVPTIYPFAFFAKAGMRLNSSGKGQDMSIEYSRAPSPRTCRCSIHRSSSSSSISTRRKRSISSCRRDCSRSPMK